MEHDRLRILNAPGPICGQAYALCDGINSLGHVAHSGVITTPTVDHNRFGYPYHVAIPIEGEWTSGVRDFLVKTIDDYDVYHFHARSFFHFEPWPCLPTLLDLVALKIAGKKVFFHFRGSEVRRADVQRERNPFHYVNSAPERFDRSDDDKVAFVRFIKSICDGFFVVDREVQENVGEGTELPIIVDMDEWDFVGQVNVDRPLIVHAPSHRGIKGTEEIVQALNKLSAEGRKFDFQLIEGLPNSEARRIYERADIIVDQLRMGWFGTLTVEAMALGKPVICYLRPDLLKAEDEFPIVNATPNNIYETLKKLISSAQLRNQISFASRQFALTNHSHLVGAKIALDSYKRAGKVPRADDMEYFLNFVIKSNPSKMRAHYRIEAYKRGAVRNLLNLAKASVPPNLKAAIKSRIKTARRK